jgi:5-methylcytosine-specific restriction endonuclease McrA
MNDLKENNRYGALLFRKEWKEKRQIILNRDNHQCINCGAKENLEIHHRQYIFHTNIKRFSLPWEYSNHLLITLCRECHSRGHAKFTVPIIKL